VAAVTKETDRLAGTGVHNTDPTFHPYVLEHDMSYPGQEPQFDPTLAAGQPPSVYGQWPPSPPPTSGKKTGIVVVSIVAVLLLAAAGAFGGLYLSAKTQLQDAQDELTKAQDAKTTAETKNTQMTKCNDAGHTLAAASLAHAAAHEQDMSKINELGLNLVLACE
jgi:uncharacterized protein HemX